MTTKNLLFIAACCLFISGCERYTVTVNEKTVYNPPALYSGHKISDAALAACVNQVITDQRITRAEQLTRLNCSHAGVASIEGITAFTGLRFLDLSDNAIGDIKPLLYLPYLETVNLKGNPEFSCQDVELLAKQVSNRPELTHPCK